MAAYPDRPGLAGERNGLAELDGERSHEAHGIGTDLVEVGPGVGGDDEAFKLGDVEHLIDRARHVDEIGA